MVARHQRKSNTLIEESSHKVIERFGVYSFPSLYGMPWNTNYFFIAFVFALCRNIVAWGTREIRVIDRETDNHLIVW
jgi:hypothetical protein